jgi:hypothetical protein
VVSVALSTYRTLLTPRAAPVYQSGIALVAAVLCSELVFGIACAKYNMSVLCTLASGLVYEEQCRGLDTYRAL